MTKVRAKLSIDSQTRSFECRGTLVALEKIDALIADKCIKG